MANEIVLVIFYVVILLYSVILHEVFHGIAALWLGDVTAKYAGRISANPLRHIDPTMTIFMPIMMLVLTGGRFAFGGAKPVPYNPYNLRDQKWGPSLVALAGPGSNIALAFLAAITAKMLPLTLFVKKDIIDSFKVAVGSNLDFSERWNTLAVSMSGSIAGVFFGILLFIIFWNVLLAFFNLIPIPPLDGSKLLFAVLKIKMETMAILEQFGFFILLFFIIFFSAPLGYFLNMMLDVFLAIAI
jgi:Zn-dependent protease